MTKVYFYPHTIINYRLYAFCKTDVLNSACHVYYIIRIIAQRFDSTYKPIEIGNDYLTSITLLQLLPVLNTVEK